MRFTLIMPSWNIHAVSQRSVMHTVLFRQIFDFRSVIFVYSLFSRVSSRVSRVDIMLNLPRREIFVFRGFCLLKLSGK